MQILSVSSYSLPVVIIFLFIPGTEAALPQLQMVQIHLTKSFLSPIYHVNIPPLVFSLIFISISSPLYPCPQPPDITKSMTSACRHIKGSYPPNKLSLPPLLPFSCCLSTLHTSTSSSPTHSSTHCNLSSAPISTLS